MNRPTPLGSVPVHSWPLRERATLRPSSSAVSTPPGPRCHRPLQRVRVDAVSPPLAIPLNDDLVRDLAQEPTTRPEIRSASFAISGADDDVKHLMAPAPTPEEWACPKVTSFYRFNRIGVRSRPPIDQFPGSPQMQDQEWNGEKDQRGNEQLQRGGHRPDIIRLTTGMLSPASAVFCEDEPRHLRRL